MGATAGGAAMAIPRSAGVPVTGVIALLPWSGGMAVAFVHRGPVGSGTRTTSKRNRGMGIRLGPPPSFPSPSPPDEEPNPFLPDTSHDPAVARCSGCMKQFTADQYIALAQEENVTSCSGCGGEVMFF